MFSWQVYLTMSQAEAAAVSCNLDASSTLLLFATEKEQIFGSINTGDGTLNHAYNYGSGTVLTDDNLKFGSRLFFRSPYYYVHM